MDMQTQWTLVVIGGLLLLFTLWMAGYYTRQINKLATRKFSKPTRRSERVIDRVEAAAAPEPEWSRPQGHGAPVPIWGVQDDAYAGRRPTRSQLQALADRINKIADEDEEAELEAMLARMQKKQNTAEPRKKTAEDRLAP